MGIFKHKGAGASDSPKKENTSVPLLDPVNTAEQIDTATTAATTSSSSTRYKRPTREQGINLVISLLVPILLYGGLSWLLIHNGVDFFLGNLIGCGLALMVLAYIQSVFKTGSKLATPIQIVLAIILILSLSLYYLPKFNKNNITQTTSTNYSSSGSETLFFVGTEQLVSNKSFPQGREVRLTVSGAPINFVTISGIKVLTQEYGTYIFRFNSVGSLIFTGSGSQSSITIKW